MELGLYLYISKINQVEFAKRIGVSRNYMNQIVNKRLKPSVPIAKLIETETQGAVSAKEVRAGYN